MTVGEVIIIIIGEITKTQVILILMDQMLHGWTKILVKGVAIEEEDKGITIMGNIEEVETIRIVVDAAEAEDIILQAIKEIDDRNVLR